MVSGFESAADAITGAVIGRTVEPGHGEGMGTADGACVNCGAALVGGYCHACGQKAHVHRSLSGIGHEIAHGVFHFEGKIWHTLPLLAFKPGQLTRRYTHGERARFISPLALFLFAVFLTFAVFETVGMPLRSGGTNINFDMSREAKAQAAVVKTLEADRAALSAKGGEPSKLDAKLREARKDLAGLERAASLTDGTAEPGADAVSVRTNSTWLDARYREAKKNPRLLIYKLQSSAYKYAWALIVLSLPFMWLMFPFRRDVHLYDHAVFVTYSLSAVMLLLVVTALVAATGADASWLLMLFPVHLFAQLKGAYGLGWWGAGWRTTFLLFAAVLVIILFAVLLLALGVMG